MTANGRVYLAYQDCDRLSGRSRIGTLTLSSKPIYHILRSSFGAIEDWNVKGRTDVVGGANCDRLSGRSRIGTGVGSGAGVGVELRSSFGAIEDWNYKLPSEVKEVVLRSSFGAIEDWN